MKLAAGTPRRCCVKLVVDANVLFAATLKRSATARLLLHQEVSAYSPRYIVEEFARKKKELESKYEGTPEELSLVFATIVRHVNIVPDQTLEPYLPAAKAITADSKDWLYAAAALSIEADIWSNDRGFKNQQRIRVWTTSELIRRLQ